MVVVTDGESHDQDIMESVIAESDKKGITRFGIAVSDDPRSASDSSSFLLIGLGVFPGVSRSWVPT